MNAVDRRLVTIVVGVVVAGGLAFGVYWGVRQNAKAEHREAMKKGARDWFEREGYARFFDERGKPDLGASSSIHGPVMPIAVRDVEHFVYFGSDLADRTELPIAESFDEVRTVAISIEDTRLYSMGALTYAATIVFVDARDKRVVARRSWSGPLPPQATTIDGMSKWDDDFWAPIATWVDSLPMAE